MARIGMQDKLARILTFLYALKDVRIRRALGKHGLDAAELAWAWEQLLLVARGRPEAALGVPADSVAQALRALDEWENHWFPIARAALGRNFPDVAQEVFYNLAQAEGRDVILTVSTLLARVEDLHAAAPGSAKAKAAELLDRRGLGAKERASAHELLATIRSLELPVAEPLPEGDDEDQLAGLWAWYREWADIARVAVRRKELRIRLGVSSPAASSPSKSGAEPEPERLP
jgi:hypothetical protein